MSGRRLSPLLLLYVTPLALFAHPLFGGDALYLREVGNFVLPLRAHVREALLSGRLPEWMPHMLLGLPLSADPSGGVFYPPSLVLLFPWPQALTVFVVGHVLVAAWGAASLARRLGAGDVGAAVGGLAFALSGYVLSMTTSVVYLCALCWAPLAIQVALSERRPSSSLAVLALLLGLQVLAGDPQAALLTAAFAGALAASTAPAARPALVRLGVILGATTLGLGVAAIQFVPALLYAPDSVRQAGVPLHIAQMFSVHPLRLIELVAPAALGTTPPDVRYLGRALLESRHSWPFAFSIYLGASAVVLLPRGARGRFGRALLGIAAVALLLALGRYTPLYALLWRALPLWSVFRYPEKMIGFFTLAAAMLVALGADRCGDGPAAARPAWIGAALLGIGAGAALCFRSLLPGGGELGGQMAGALAMAGAQATALGLLLAFGGAWAPRLLPLCIALDLSAHALRLVDALPPPSGRPLPLAIADGRDRSYPPRGFMTASARARIDAAGTVREMERRAETLALANRHVGRLQHLQSLTAAEPASGAALIEALHGHGKRMLDLLDVEWVLMTEDDPANPALVPTGASLFGVSLRKNRDAMPRARLYFHTARAPHDAAALHWIADPEFPADQVAIVGPMGPALRSSRKAVPCAVTAYRSERVDVRCSAPEPGLLVLAEQHLAGWRATLDGRRAPIHRADFALRAVLVPAGNHTVTFTYATPGLVPGAWISAGALALCAGLLIRSRRR